MSKVVEKDTVLLNALPLNAFPLDHFTIKVRRVSLSDIRIYNNVKCYIRHEGTVKLISRVLGVELKPSADLYKFNPNDAIYIITLKKPVRGTEASEISKEDVDVFEIKLDEVT